MVNQQKNGWHIWRDSLELTHQEAGVKDVVQVHLRQKLQSVGNRVDDGDHLVRSIEPWLELPGDGHLEKHRCAVAETEPHSVAHGEGYLVVVLDVVALVDS
jgi:hypothetical protein